ncbi:MAG: ribosome maturation factor RimM [Clostridiales bacterium]|nr:ribosome maturation factor RimM [Clostridiales bacterium]
MDFKIGKITKAHGIRGEVRVFPTTDDPSRFQLLIGKKINVNNNFLKLTNARLQKETVILKFAEINDRNASEELVGAVISIPEEMALPLDSDEYYIRDLIGLCAETESGEILGILIEVMQTAANDVYAIETPRGKTILIPAIKDVVVKIDITERKIILRLPEGLQE